MLSLANCRVCGQVFQGSPEVVLCSECLERREQNLQKVEEAVDAESMSTPREIAMRTDLSLETVRNILHSSKVLGSQTRSDEMCERCRRRVSLNNSTFCLTCQLTLITEIKKSFADLSARQSKDRIGRDEPKGVRASLNEKRRRTGSHRFGSGPEGR